MPDFEIHDSETGLKLAVTGDSEPTQEEATALMEKEMMDISTNLFSLPDGKFYLDVGPLQSHRTVWDGSSKTIADADSIMDAHKDAAKFANENAKTGDWSKLYDQQRDRFSKTNKLSFPTIAQEAAKNVPPGTLIINAHGSKESKNFSSDWGHEFSMGNIASLIKNKGSVSNVVNLACYGASCTPKDYEAAFPSVSSIRHIDTNHVNTMNLKAIMDGKFFDSRGVDDPQTTWVKMDSNWIQLPRKTRFRATPEK